MISKKEQIQLSDAMEMSLSETSLILRTVNILENASPSIQTVGDLLHTSVDDLLQISNFGRKTLTQVYAALSKVGFERQISKEVTRTVSPKKENIPLFNTKLPNKSCALLATGGVLLVKDAIYCSEETLLFLLGQDSNGINANVSLIMLKRVLDNLGV